MSEPILLGYEEASNLLGIPVNTLKDYRAKGKGPRSAVICGKVKYRRADVLAWIDECFEATTKGGTKRRPFNPTGRRQLIDA